MRQLAGTVAVASILFLLASVSVAANEIAATARSLAENVLGRGTVTSLTIADQGATVLIRWESATWRPNLKVDAVRDGLVAEAQLATGSILGRLYTVSKIKFSIKRADAMLASGENNRSKGLSLTFAASLGGGTYVPAAATGQPARSKPAGGSSSTAKD
ncbi:MAG TPA: hypothetical protein VGR24_12415 [bacterium]|jgi:hypothetical protein|nr:hypothetical protein [bacterium]